MPPVDASNAKLASVLRPAVMRLRRRLVSERGVGTNLSMTAAAVLGHLFLDEMTVGALAALERVLPPTMTRTVNCLEADGYVARRQSETDRRQVHVTITEKGRELVLANRALRDEWLSSRLGDLTPDERSVLRQAAPILEKLANS